MARDAYPAAFDASRRPPPTPIYVRIQSMKAKHVLATLSFFIPTPPRFVASDLAIDIIVYVGDVKFHLHKTHTYVPTNAYISGKFIASQVVGLGFSMEISTSDECTQGDFPCLGWIGTLHV